MKNIVIIGNGISGITTARFIRKLSNHNITVISDEGDYFFSRTALMYVYMGHLRPGDVQPYEQHFWEKNRIQLVRARIEEVDFSKKILLTQEQQKITYDQLIIATGSKPNKFDWPGQNLQGVGGLYHWQDLEQMEQFSSGLKRAVIVGGGLIGIEMAEMFHSRHIPVTLLVRENSFWDIVLPKEESAMINRHIKEHGIDLRLNTELKAILPDEGDRCCAVITNTREKIECGYVGLTVGVSPNIDFLKKTELEINRGILVDHYLRTNIPDVYAIGDCAEMRKPYAGRRPIEAIWYTGRMMGEALAHTICRKPTAYNPGIWFNSAKFLDIEYQVYGDVPAIFPEHYTSVYWEHSDGKKSIRIVYQRETGQVVGFNLMGVRYRQEVCEKWLRTKAHIETVLQQLGLANFDPEFYPQHEVDLVSAYNHITGKDLRLKQKRGLTSVLQFLRQPN
ncbi:NAD(P)/FAD-dependent oxidoreductase [Haliscomenobacter sp.]|uniref:NAD(P)/FAD-dependent oxidoreductase n=1 Tax=Haliscomenobacter sp. TaxID=2717303 RepID=UPI0035946135